VLSAFLLIHFFWLWLITIVIQAVLYKQVFFEQKRPGKHGKPFQLYKIMTMENGQIHSSYSLFLRSTGIDEWPQLWSIFIGDMSFIGPRPLLMEYLPLYDENQMRRHEVRPGLTGWAQVHGRNASTWNDRFNLDIWYIENKSLLIDFQIIFLTFKQLFAGNNQVEMPIWNGKN